MNCEICVCFYSHFVPQFSREIIEIFSFINNDGLYFCLFSDSSINMWSSAKGPTRLRWDLLVVALVITLNIKVSQLNCQIPNFFP